MKPVKIMLDREREIKMGSKAFVTMEKLAGKSMDKLDFDTQEAIFIMLGAGLAHSMKNVTLEKVYDIVDNAVDKLVEEKNLEFMEAYQQIMERIGEAMNEAMPTKR